MGKKNISNLSLFEKVILVITVLLSVFSIILSAMSYYISKNIFENDYKEDILIFQEQKHNNEFTRVEYSSGIGEIDLRPYAFYFEYKVTLVNKRSQPVTIIDYRLMPNNDLTNRTAGVYYSKITDIDIPFDIPGNSSKVIFVRLYHPISASVIDLDKLKKFRPDIDYKLDDVLYSLEDYGRTFKSNIRLMPNINKNYERSEINVGNNYPDIGDSIHNFKFFITSANNNKYSKELLCYY
jgi:hypothetical protein